MQPYTQTNPSSIFFREPIEVVVGDLRERECQLFREDVDSPVALRLASIRGEFQRLLAGERVRVDAIERTLAPPADSLEGAESDLAAEPEAVEVCGA